MDLNLSVRHSLQFQIYFDGVWSCLGHVLAQERTLLKKKKIWIGSLFRSLPVQHLVLTRRYMTNGIKRNGVEYLVVGRVAP